MESEIDEIEFEMPKERTKTIKVCHKCNRPIYFKNEKGYYKCYNCKIKIKNPKERLRLIDGYEKRKKKIEIDDSDLLTREELFSKIKNIDGEKKLMNQAFISCLYLPAARVEEITGLINQVRRNRINEPLKKNQISFERIEGTEFMIFKKLPILKRKLKNDRIPTRNVPILVENEIPLVNYIKEYIKTKEDDEPLFNITYQQGWNISKRIMINDDLNAFNHYWRHLRLTHLAENYDYSSLDLQQFVGWANTLMASKYTHFNWQTLAKKQMRVKYNNQGE